MIVSTVEMHTGGEPTRIIVGGWPDLAAPTLLGKRRECLEKHDHLRRGLMLEPRGHDGMYGALLVKPDHPEADLAVLFMHNEGYSTMCGHATVALARWAVESGRATGPVVRLQCPCGLVVAAVAPDGSVRFESVPSFVYALDRIAPTRSWGPVTVDIGFGGAFYAVLPALLGMIARQAFPHLDNPELALPMVLRELLPWWLGALLLGAVFSAELSAGDAVTVYAVSDPVGAV